MTYTTRGVLIICPTCDGGGGYLHSSMECPRCYGRGEVRADEDSVEAEEWEREEASGRGS